MNDEPEVRPAHFPREYGARGGEGDEPLPWEEVEARLCDALNYWITTVTPSGVPHARPVDGVWVQGALCFGGSDDTRWVRNLQTNPAMSVHLPSGDDVVVLEGTVEYVTDPEDPRASASSDATRKKYPQYFSSDDPVPFQPF
ncbi:MAG TPA: pyridoxamine 5'-phosphate oxidase family protein [Acidimicrobiales bacterium]|nr:pyridoxamine 5'-phosphate oxidase family protein [Acidimicrobiales bacterium]